MPEITVIKENVQHQETWRYPAEILETRADAVLLEAFFNREDIDMHGFVMARGDRFVEIYYSDHWYNIYEIYGKTEQQLKGWYCNVSLPAEITANEIRYVDLALDLLVFPDGRQIVLDEDEFEALGLDPVDQKKAWEALQELQILFQTPVAVRLARS